MTKTNYKDVSNEDDFQYIYIISYQKTVTNYKNVTKHITKNNWPPQITSNFKGSPGPKKANYICSFLVCLLSSPAVLHLTLQASH